ncbi:hypothetical protein BCR44DRAFT_1424576 [Catenaria anguillulae PL171]|uniref:Fibronectin type-III domain-containing protein n=1 Tax=Catenaria anguillulae PL171 TaxID=765915 RepID=A0A1Y2I001_9FUNG|nr:hypothetical protein BCR44DRAFT_1424576 [Catenaria anguillulae PL171]
MTASTSSLAAASGSAPADLALTHAQHHASAHNPLPHSSIQLVVGKIDAGVAILLTGDHHILEFPTLLLPPDIATGSIIDVSVSRNARAESESLLEFSQLQDSILAELGDADPVAPTLATAANATETSVVLQWSGGLAVGGTQQESTLDIVVNNDVIASHQVAPGALSGECEVDGLEPGYEYTCQVVLRCGGVVVASEAVVVKTLGERERVASPRVERRASLTMAAGNSDQVGSTTETASADQVQPARPASPPTNESGAAISPRGDRQVAIDTQDEATPSSSSPPVLRAPSPLPPVTTAPPRSRSTSPTRRTIPEFTDPADEVIKKAVSTKNLAATAAASPPTDASAPVDGPVETDLDAQGEPSAEQDSKPANTDPLGLDVVPAADPTPAPLLDLLGSPQAAPAPAPTAADILMGGFDAAGLMDVSLDAPAPESNDLLGLEMTAQTDEQAAAKEPLPASPDRAAQEQDDSTAAS